MRWTKLAWAVAAFALLFATSALTAPCDPSPTLLCLAQSRFQVEVSWRDFAGNTGTGQAVPITADTGYFWFFNSANVELVVKVLDARAVNAHFWVFFGALSNVEYTLRVTDSTTGAIKTYFNPSGQFASVGDTAAFPASTTRPVMKQWVEIEGSAAPTESLTQIQRFIDASSSAPSADTPCSGSETELLVSDCRFRITVNWKDFQGGKGQGQAVPLTGDTGYFWFFNDTNVEIVIKVLDARALDGHHWVFFGALSNVEYTVTVTDTRTGKIKTYENPAHRFASVGDTSAFHPQSFELIALAETTGTINSETALLYRVYSLFGDSRLPAKYRGDDGNIIDSLYLSDVINRFPTLSQETQDAVQPFLVPPVYAGSWAARKALGATVPPVCDATQPGWGRVDTVNGAMRIWYQLDSVEDAAKARAAAAVIDAVTWPKIAGLMGNHRPLSDSMERCNGGDGRLDMYLVDIGRAMVTNYQSGCGASPAFILLGRHDSDAVIAHEIFHAFQYSFRACLKVQDHAWWTEGSAQWAMHFVFPNNQEEQGAAPSLLGIPEESLDFVNDAHEYGTYLLPFYVQNKTGSADFVRTAWERSAGGPALEAVDSAIGGFENVWPEFVKRNWNRKPIEDYSNWDSMNHRPPGILHDVNLQGVLTSLKVPIKIDLPRLSTAYHYFTFDDPNVSTVVFWNGVTTKLDLRDVTMGVHGPQYVNDEVAGDAAKGAHITALIRMGASWKEEDWTNRHFVTYCRDQQKERIDELVLIISNSEFKDRGRKLKAPGLDPILYASGAGCWKWVGRATFTAPNVPSGQTRTTAEVIWTRTEESSHLPFSIQYRGEGQLTWSVNGPGCSDSGVSALGIAQLITNNFAPTTNERHLTYLPTGYGPPVTVCSASGGGFPWLTAPPTPIVPGNPFARWLKVSSNGKALKDSFKLGLAEWTWEFKAERE